MKESQAAVIDAGLAVFSLLDTSYSETAAKIFDRLAHEKIIIFAPRLWRYEVTSVIHKYLFDGILESNEALEALEIAFNLGVNFYDEDETLCRAAFLWADRLGQKAAYDGFYLALAEKLGVDFWTADERLANRARQTGVTWVHWMGESGQV